MMTDGFGAEGSWMQGPGREEALGGRRVCVEDVQSELERGEGEAGIDGFPPLPAHIPSP